MLRAVLVSILVLAIDQFSKIAIVRWMDLRTLGEIDVFPPYLVFRMAWNQGVNFGLFANDNEVTRWILVAMAFAVSVWLIGWSHQMRRPIGPVFAGMVVGGAIGNGIDRIAYGAVADFLNMSCCGFNNPFAFNIADVAIFIGALGLVLFSNKLEKRY